MTLLLLALSVAHGGPVVVDAGKGARLDLSRAPAASGTTGMWVRCSWVVRRSEGPESRLSCGGEGVLGWTWADGAFTWTVDRLTPEPGCGDAAQLAGSRWTGAIGDGFVVERVALTPADTVSTELAGDLLAELGDSLQRLVVPVPDERLREGAVWALLVVERAGELQAEIRDEWTARRDGGAVHVGWQEEARLSPVDPADTEAQPTTERWSGELVLDPQALLATGRWRSERPVRIARGERFVESTASCTGELRPIPAEGAEVP